MQSRSYLCRRMDRAEGGMLIPVGVLVIESLAAKGVSGEFNDMLAGAYQLELPGTECSAAMRLDKLNGERGSMARKTSSTSKGRRRISE